MKKQNMLW